MSDQHNPYSGNQPTPNQGFNFKGFARDAAERVIARHDQTTDTGVIWSATGKPLTRLGAGRYSLTQDYLVVEKGMVSTDRQQIRTHEIFDVDGRQSMAQKARDVGTVTLHAKRANGEFEIVELVDIPNFRQAVEIINATAEDARIRIQRRANAQTLTHEGHQPVASVSSAPSSDLNAELSKLAELKAAGVLSDDEFAAAKRKILGL
ncbi:SHOCT domain-containing protein [Corynebacterium tuberculostearicum]|uniref:SHOCT domain-containing protein n=1 Tax=Corynebacterium tuberculostearicum TaxID=38304 RepID=UPI0038D0BE27